VTLYHFVTLSYPFSGRNVYDLLENIASGEYVVPGYIDPLVIDLLEGVYVCMYVCLYVCMCVWRV